MAIVCGNVANLIDLHHRISTQLYTVAYDSVSVQAYLGNYLYVLIANQLYNMRFVVIYSMLGIAVIFSLTFSSDAYFHCMFLLCLYGALTFCASNIY